MNHGMWNRDEFPPSWKNPRWTSEDGLDNAAADERLHTLRKAIREQHILLSALGVDDAHTAHHHGDIAKLKQRIRGLSCELQDEKRTKGVRGGISLQWERYQSNLRQLEALDDQKRALKKEIQYLADISKSTQSMLVDETENFNKIKLALARGDTNIPTELMTKEERIKAKAQAMIAMRLNSRAEHADACPVEAHNGRERLAEIDRLANEIELCTRDMERAIEEGFSDVEYNLNDSQRMTRDRQMFEDGLLVSDELARFIDEIAVSPAAPSPPPLPIPAIVTPSEATVPPPPVPTTQRPGSPRSADDIKAEAHRRIEERRRLFINKHKRSVEFDARHSNGELQPQSKDPESNVEKQNRIDEEVKKRLDVLREKRIKMRQEATEVEEKRKKAAAEATAIAEAEMLEEKRLQQKEEEERLEKQRLQEEEERLQREKEERERREQEILQKRAEDERQIEEARQRKARLAAEKAAMEKRLRQEEMERREREMEAARLEELRRRIAWEEAEAKKIREAKEEELKRQQLLQEAEAKRLEEEEKIRMEKEDLERREKEEQARREEEQRIKIETTLNKEYPPDNIISSQSSSSSQTPSPVQQHSPATAGTSGYGVDIEDEVDFSTIYRVKTLYEYSGVREGDLSFTGDEIIKAHPSKDKASDWWYGTSLFTNYVGFFPRAYVEIVEQAFRVRTLYAFQKTRDDDLGFGENEIIIVQPFQDEGSEWWYGTNEETLESGYFPISYAKIIDSDEPSNELCTSVSSSANVPIVSPKNSNHLSTAENDQTRGLSAPNTPIMKKTTLGKAKQNVSRRRRAASNASMSGNSIIVSPGLQRQDADLQLDNPTVTHWASMMDEQELSNIPAEERSRQEAIFELIATERTYLRDLQMIINVFYADSSKYLSPEEQDVVFSNIDDLLLCNTALLSDFESRQRECVNVIHTIGDVFLKHAGNLKAYSTFCRNQSFASKFLQKKRDEDRWFEVFLKTAQTRPECRSLDLSHFLLEPVQRITRYPLLLRQILKSTPKKHSDHGLIKSALARAEKVLDDVNEETRRYENRQKMGELSRILDMEEYGQLDTRGRDFVMEGILYKAKSGRKLHGYLFSDLLLLAEPLKSLSSKGYLYRLYREPMNIERVSIRQQQNMSLKQTFSNNSTEDTSLQLAYGNQVITVKASSASQKRKWVSQIQHYSTLQMTMRH